MERGSRFMLGSQRSRCHDQAHSGVIDSSEGVGQKGRMSSMTDRYRVEILDGMLQTVRVPDKSPRIDA